MTNSRSFVPAAVALAALFAALCSLCAAVQDDVATLVSQLPTNNSSISNMELEKRIADLGPAALPDLERELRYGTRSQAAVRVLSRIPGKESTDLIFGYLRDPNMREGVLIALAKRTLSNDQIVIMLEDDAPRVVLYGLSHAAGRMEVPGVRDAVERVFDRDTAIAQFHNEYGASTAGPDFLWDVRLASGSLLCKDMLPEIRAKAGEILADLKKEALNPTKPDEPVWLSYASQAELTICRGMDKLFSLGKPIRDMVEDAAKEAEGNHAKVLDMALARLGDQTRVMKVTECLTDSDSPTIRFCAAWTLRALRDPSTIPALRKALRDPYRRQDGSCARIGDGMIYPVRNVAAGALVKLGDDPKEVWAATRK